MTAQVWAAIASSLTTIAVTALARMAVKARKQFEAHGAEHQFLMKATARNTRYIARIMKHLDMTDSDDG